MKLPRTSTLTVALLATALPTLASAADSDTGTWSFNARYRHEYVNDEAFAKRANADTLRLRVGFAPKFSNGWEGFIEAEGVAELNHRFNSGANRQTTYPAVGDARVLELNQGWSGWKNEHYGFRVGRQRILLDNQRFIGNSGWRQNEQTFDAITGFAKIGSGTHIQGMWLARVHRVAGDQAIDRLARRHELDGRVLHIDQSLKKAGTLTGYGYWIENLTVRSASARTLGVRWYGLWPVGTAKIGATAEFAEQKGYADAHVGTAQYVFLEPRLEVAGTTYRIGYEKLGRGQPRSFQTPLATLHAFNGWADKFGVTPVGGLVDRYASVQRGYEVAGHRGKWELAWHDYRADGAAAYGSEWNASLGLTLKPGLQALVKVADYQSRGFARDTRKAWLQVEWSR